MSFAAKYVGFWLAYTLPTLVFFVCVPVLYFGRNRYVRQPPSGSVLGNFFKLIGYATRGRWSVNPVRTVKNLGSNDLWSSALPSRLNPEERPTWMVWDDDWVWEVRRALKACQVFALYPAFCE